MSLCWPFFGTCCVSLQGHESSCHEESGNMFFQNPKTSVLCYTAQEHKTPPTEQEPPWELMAKWNALLLYPDIKSSYFVRGGGDSFESVYQVIVWSTANISLYEVFSGRQPLQEIYKIRRFRRRVIPRNVEFYKFSGSAACLRKRHWVF
jgi:hypothetical protein